MKASEDQWNRWIDGQLPEDEAAAMEAMVAEDPTLQGDQAFFARLSADMKEAVPAERTPPFADFFNSQLQKRLWDLEHPEPVESRWKLPSWLSLSWAVPLGAAAAIVIGLSQIGLLGDRQAHGSQITYAYTPDEGVHAETTYHEEANAMVIRLTGIQPLPEGFDLKLTANNDPDASPVAATEEPAGLDELEAVFIHLDEAPQLQVATPPSRR